MGALVWGGGFVAVGIVLCGGGGTRDNPDTPSPADDTVPDAAPADAAAAEAAPVPESTTPPPDDAWPEPIERGEVTLTRHSAKGGTTSVSQAAGGVGGGKTLLVEVLDVTPKFGALKVVYRREVDEMFEDGEPPACDYAGMEKYPDGTGVALALITLATGDMELWEVYPAAMSQEDCASHAESKAGLEQAKAAFVEAELDIARKPAPIPVQAGACKPPNPPAWGEVTYTVAAQQASDPDNPLFVEAFGRTDEAPMEGVARGTVSINGHPAFHDTIVYGLMMGGSGDVSFPKAYPVAGGLVFLVRLNWFSGRGGDNTGYSLSPVLGWPGA